MIILQNMDVPGMIGHVGAILGSEDVNIASMQLGRHASGGKAIMLLNVDDVVQDRCLSGLESHENILWAKGIGL